MKKAKPYSSSTLKRQILADAKALSIAEKWAETIATKTVKHVDVWIKDKGTVTEDDIVRVAHKKLKELNSDLAYIYKNRGKML
jgi:2-phosphoglycerate kinase